ncbi:aldo/keto reductase [Bacillus sp. FJAT-29790]|uniref:aldo/keto reductase n=1 Tax=Bacillus sp. FJAT-29790 TaxID=1895002 RepID=UPI001C239668|nr:aldo/keto reductase [Bacillus sp. FJAT-29790]MBU8880121.1 aldo/keto reductase [Bacillus sp. FJAT-29790]
MKLNQDTISLHNGVNMPQFGLGVYKVEEGQQVGETVKLALEIGYRLIDTAAFYDNEEGVGRAIKESGIPREDIFITTKVWNTDQGYDETLAAFDKSMQKLGLDYLDLYLIHWPVKEKYLETWKALEKLYHDGKVRAIGVSNFQIHHLKDLMENSSEKPVVNQIELHPRLSQVELRAFCKENNIKVEAWSPIGRGRLLDEPTIKQIAEKYGKTPAQIILRWHLQNDVIIIPKSVNPQRLKENADIFAFELMPDDMTQINELNINERFGPDPDSFEF